jgi:hypothetical protein
LLPHRLDRKTQHGHKGREDEASSGEDGGVGVGGAAVDGDDGGTEPRNAVEHARDAGAGAAAGGGEDLRGVGVENAVHDVLEEGLEAGADELDVGVGGGGEAEEEDGSHHRREGDCSLAADVLDVDGVAGYDGARDADDGGDGVVAVGDVGGGRGVAAAGVLEVLGQEGVEEGVAHSDGGPAEPEDERC